MSDFDMESFLADKSPSGEDGNAKSSGADFDMDAFLDEAEVSAPPPGIPVEERGSFENLEPIGEETKKLAELSAAGLIGKGKKYLGSQNGEDVFEYDAENAPAFVPQDDEGRAVYERVKSFNGVTLDHFDRPMRINRDEKGFVTGYSTTEPTVVPELDGTFSVIPTMWRGEGGAIESAIDEEDAARHYRDTFRGKVGRKVGERFGNFATLEEAEAAAKDIHDLHQRAYQQKWNQWIHEHWDEMSDEIRNYPGMAEIHAAWEEAGRPGVRFGMKTDRDGDGEGAKEWPDGAKKKGEPLGALERLQMNLQQETGERYSKGSALGLTLMPFGTQAEAAHANQRTDARERLRSGDYANDEEARREAEIAGLEGVYKDIERATAGGGAEAEGRRRELLSMAAEAALLDEIEAKNEAAQTIEDRPQTTWGKAVTGLITTAGYSNSFIYGSMIMPAFPLSGRTLAWANTSGAAARYGTGIIGTARTVANEGLREGMKAIGRSAVKSAVTSIPITAVGTAERATGLANKSYEIDEYDRVKAIDDNYGTLASLAKGGAGSLMENLVVEGLTDEAINLGVGVATSLLGLAKIPGADKSIVSALKGIGGKATRKLMQNKFGRALLLVGKGYNKISQVTNFESMPFEQFEEIIQPIFDDVLGLDKRKGERTQTFGEYADKMFTWENQRDIALGLVGYMLIQAGGGYVVGRYSAQGRQQAKDAREARQQLVDAKADPAKVRLLSDEDAMSLANFYVRLSGNPDLLTQMAERLGNGADLIVDEMMSRVGAKMGGELRDLGGTPREFTIPTRRGSDGRPEVAFQKQLVKDGATGEMHLRNVVADEESGVYIIDNDAKGTDRAYTVRNDNTGESADFMSIASARRCATLLINEQMLMEKRDEAKMNFIENLRAEQYGNANVEQYRTLAEAVEAGLAHGVDVTKDEGFRPDRRGWNITDKDGNRFTILVRDNIKSPWEVERVMRHENVGHSATANGVEFMDEALRGRNPIRSTYEDYRRANEERSLGMDDGEILREAVANTLQMRSHNPTRGERLIHGVRDWLRRHDVNLGMSNADMEVEVAKIEAEMRGSSGTSQIGPTYKNRTEFTPYEGEAEEGAADEAGNGADEAPAQPEQGEEQGQEAPRPEAGAAPGAEAPDAGVVATVDNLHDLLKGASVELAENGGDPSNPGHRMKTATKEEIAAKQQEIVDALNDPDPQNLERFLDKMNSHACRIVEMQQFKEDWQRLHPEVDLNSTPRALANERKALELDIESAKESLANHPNSESLKAKVKEAEKKLADFMAAHPDGALKKTQDGTTQPSKTDNGGQNPNTAEHPVPADSIGGGADQQPMSESSFWNVMHRKGERRRVPVDSIKIPDTQFKENADPKTGVVKGQELGEYYENAENPIAIYERKDGTMEIVTGRHRLDAAKRSGWKDIDARIFREADGYTPEDMRLYDAVANILDEKGTVKDYVRFFDESGFSEEDAKSSGILNRQKGRMAFGIVQNATDDTRGAIDWEGTGGDGLISVEQAAIIADAAPKQAALQRILVRRALDGVRGKKLAILARSLAEEAKRRKDAPKEEGTTTPPKSADAPRVVKTTRDGESVRIVQDGREYEVELPDVKFPKTFTKATSKSDWEAKMAEAKKIADKLKEKAPFHSVINPKTGKYYANDSEVARQRRREVAAYEEAVRRATNQAFDEIGEYDDSWDEEPTNAVPKKEGATTPPKGAKPAEGGESAKKSLVWDSVTPERSKFMSGAITDPAHIKAIHELDREHDILEVVDPPNVNNFGTMYVDVIERKGGRIVASRYYVDSSYKGDAYHRVARGLQGGELSETKLQDWHFDTLRGRRDEWLRNEAQDATAPTKPAPKSSAPKPAKPAFKRGDRVFIKGAAENQRVTFLKANADGTADVQVKTPGANRYAPEKVETRTVPMGDISATGMKETLTEAEKKRLEEGVRAQQTIVMPNAAAAKEVRDALDAIDFDTPELSGDNGRFIEWASKWKLDPSKKKYQREWAQKNHVDFDTPEFDPDKFGRLVTGVGNLVDKLTKYGYKDFKSLATYIYEQDTAKYGRAKPVLQDIWNAVARARGLARVSDAQADKVYAAIEKPQETAPARETPKAPPANKLKETRISDAAEEIAALIERGEKFTRKDVTDIVERQLGGKVSNGDFDAKQVTDILELGVNKWIAKQSYDGEGGLYFAPTGDAKTAVDKIRGLRDMLANIPTQTTRSIEQDKMQQFSTPPQEAFAAAWVANMNDGDVMLEPSAGIGGLAVFGANAGAKVITNELSPRRAEILEQLGLGKPFEFNAENLYAFLEPDIKAGKMKRPTVVVMNPPFSNSQRTDKKNTHIGADHVEQALKLLAPGGRLVAVVGNGMAHDRPAFKAWWDRIGREYTVRANVGVNGQEYAKYGTTFDNNIIVIDKVAPNGSITPIYGKIESLDELPALLEGVRNDRPQIKNQKLDTRVDERIQQQAGGTEPVHSGGPLLPTGNDGDGSAQPDGRRVSGGNGRGTGSGRPEGRGVADGRQAGESGERGLDKPLLEEGLAVQSVDQAREIADGTFSEYRPSKVRIPGMKPHPTALVESSAMASVQPPNPTYSPKIPKKIIEDGVLSEAQIEQVIYAGQAHEQMLGNGERKGYFIGDGTGVGKGREISGIILDNFNNGRRKAVWVSKTGDLSRDAKRDLEKLGLGGELFTLESKNLNSFTSRQHGVAFTTYSSLASEHEGIDANGVIRADPKAKGGSRMQLLAKWLGKDFDGVIVFDESHKAGNAISVKGKRGNTDPSDAALAVIDLQKILPNARIVYVSATGATEVRNLAYATRLGLWGRGTAFKDRDAFITQVSNGGISVMEIVARDMKAMGVYMARTLSYEGIENERVTHELSPDQVKQYNLLAETWQMVMGEIESALISSNGIHGKANGNAKSAFWGAHQRFFNQTLTAMQMPSVLAKAREMWDAGYSPVFQLVSTNEATQKKALDKARKEGSFDVENLDLSPREILIGFVEQSFPTALYVEEQTDGGKTRWVPQPDGHGGYVKDPAAVERKERLLGRLRRMKIGESPLDMILNEFGHENVAEITGRKSRREMVRNEDGEMEARMVKRTKNNSKHEADDFNDGKRTVLVFSGAGNTGFSFHADRNFKNQRRRAHFLIEAGYNAADAIQGLGRTHRSNESSHPIYELCSTNLPGHKRFMSTIARRLAQLGSLTAGDRSSSGSGVFSEADNLENQYAKNAVLSIFEEMFQSDSAKFDRICTEMGFMKARVNSETGEREYVNTLINEDGEFDPKEELAVPHFLNRILAMKIDAQNELFDEFSKRMAEDIERAKENGTFDPGMEKLKGITVEVKNRTNLWTDAQNIGSTDIVEVGVTKRSRKTDYERARKQMEFYAAAGAVPRVYTHNASGDVLMMVETKQTKTMKDGSIVNMFRQLRPNGGTGETTETAVEKNYTQVLRDEEGVWTRAYEATPDLIEQSRFFANGTLLPIWDRLNAQNPRFYKIVPTGGSETRAFLGMEIAPENVDNVLARFGKSVGAVEVTPDVQLRRVMKDGKRVELQNGWTLKRVKVLGDNRIEIDGVDEDADVLRLAQEPFAYTEKIGYLRVFLKPNAESMAQFLAEYPAVPDKGSLATASGAAQDLGGDKYKAPLKTFWSRIERATPADATALGDELRNFIVRLSSEQLGEVFDDYRALDNDELSAARVIRRLALNELQARGALDWQRRQQAESESRGGNIVNFDTPELSAPEMNRIAKKYGTTDEYVRGWILPDGRNVDLNPTAEGAWQDHDDIRGLLDKRRGVGGSSVTLDANGREEAMRAGAIRYHNLGDEAIIDVWRKPSARQISALYDYVEKGEFDPGAKVTLSFSPGEYITYDSVDEMRKRLVNDIRRHYSEVNFDTPELTPAEAEYDARKDKTPTEKDMREVFGMTNDEIAAALNAQKMEPMKGVRKSDEQLWQQAEALLSNPTYMAKLSRAAFKFARPLRDYENVALSVLFRQREVVVNELEKRRAELAAIPEEDLKETPELADELKQVSAKLAQARARMNETATAMMQGASEQGRSLRSNRVLLDKFDLSYAGISQVIAEEVGGADRITPEMDAQIRDLAKLFEDLDAQGRRIATERLKPLAEKVIKQTKDGLKVRKATERKAGDEAKRVTRNYQDALNQIEVGAVEVGGTLIGISDQQYPSWGKWLKALGEFHCFENPNITEEECINAILEDISPFMVDEHGNVLVDADQVRDALTGFGHNYRQSRYDSQRLMNDLKSQARLKRQLDWMDETNTLPPATGMVRDEPSDTTRDLQKQVAERKKEVPDAGRDERRLKGVLDSAKTRVRNRIADLQRAIETGERIPASERKVVEDMELRELKKRKAELQEVYDEMFKTDRTMTDAQRIAATEKALQRELEHAMEDFARAQTGDFSKRPTRPGVTSDTIETLRGRIRDVRDSIRELKKAKYEFGMTPDEIAALNARKVMNREKALMRQVERIATGDIGTQKKPQPPMPPEMQKQYDEMARQMKNGRRRLNQMREEARRRSLPAWRRVAGDYFTYFNGMFTAHMASFDRSAVMRQALKLTMSHPLWAGGAMKSAEIAAWSERQFQQINEDLLADPAIREAVERFGLKLRSSDIANVHDVEMFSMVDRPPPKMIQRINATIDRIPGLGRLYGGLRELDRAVLENSERHYVTYLNLMAAQTYKTMLGAIPGATDWQKREAAQIVNMLAGAGAMSDQTRAGINKLNDMVGHLIWSPNLWISQIQQFFYADVLHPVFASREGGKDGGLRTKEEMKQVVKEAAKLRLRSELAILAIGSMLALLWSDDDWEEEWKKAWKEGRIWKAINLTKHPVLGKTHIDLEMGQRTVSRFVSQFVTGEYETSSGKVVKAGDFGAKDLYDMVGRMVGGKLSPAFGTAVEIANRKMFSGEPLDWQKVLTGMLPLTPSDVVQSAVEDEWTTGQAPVAIALAILGAGGNVYDEKYYERAVNDFLNAKERYAEDVRGEIDSRIRAVKRLERRVKEMEKKGAPTEDAESEVQKMRGEIMNLLRESR